MRNPFASTTTFSMVCGLNNYTLLISFLILLNSSPVFAAAGLARACAVDLGLSDHDRRNLRVSDELLAFAQSDAFDHRLLEALGRIFSSLDDRHLHEMAPWLGGEGPAGIDERLRDNPFFRAQPKALTVEASANYLNMRQFGYELHLDAFDLGVLASLFPAIRHVEMEDTYILPLNSEAWTERLLTKVRRALKQERFRQVSYLLLSDRRNREYIKDKMDSTLIPMGRVMPLKELEASAERIRANTLLPKDNATLFSVFTSLVDKVIAFGEEIRHEPFLKAKGQILLERGDFLNLVERYYLERLRLQAGRADLMSYIDYLAFDRPLPHTPAELRQMMTEEAKRLLNPLKARFSRYQSLHQRELDAAIARDLMARTARTDFKLVDRYAGPPCSKKRNAPTEPAAPPVVAPTVECDDIPAELDLMNFTSYVDAPRSPLELDERTEYLVKYRRMNEKDRRVRFSGKLLHWAKKHPEEARDVLDAFVLGRARAKRENGIKIYFRELSGPRVYQIKTHAKVRALAFKVDHVWQLVAPSHKDTIHVDVENVSPL